MDLEDVAVLDADTVTEGWRVRGAVLEVASGFLVHTPLLPDTPRSTYEWALPERSAFLVSHREHGTLAFNRAARELEKVEEM